LAPKPRSRAPEVALLRLPPRFASPSSWPRPLPVRTPHHKQMALGIWSSASPRRLWRRPKRTRSGREFEWRVFADSMAMRTRRGVELANRISDLLRQSFKTSLDPFFYVLDRAVAGEPRRRSFEDRFDRWAALRAESQCDPGSCEVEATPCKGFRRHSDRSVVRSRYNLAAV
jgi:hypothetical protein